MCENKHHKRNPFEEYCDSIEGNGPQTTLFAILKNAGIPLPNPQNVAEHEMHDVLWEMIHGLWDQRVVLYCTDHLSDRELYTLLWKDLLLDDEPILPDDFAVTTHLDTLGRWSEKDTELFLRHYADEDTRRRWGEEFGKVVPEHVDPPYQRDRFLPGH